jgi:hypothetical protein
MPHARIVALVVPPSLHRKSPFREHLRAFGFEVRELDSFAQASIYSLVVLYLEAVPDETMLTAIDAYLRGSGRLIVITAALAAMRGLVAPPERLHILVPPVFPWQLRHAVLGSASPVS